MPTQSYSVSAIPAFQDNYIWCLRRGQQCWVVDPGDAAPVLAWLKREQVELSGILITHHHWDHVNGIESLCTHWPEIEVYGPATESIPNLTQPLRAGATVDLFDDSRLQVMEVPGHTAGHIAYFDNSAEPRLFCGDTLFSGGCGRLFEGTAQQMHDSLQALSQLPTATLVYCTHEYTEANLRFALAVEPDNADLCNYQREVQSKRAENKMSLPSSLSRELAINPFLRTEQPQIQAAVAAHAATNPELLTSVETFRLLRLWKDNS